MMDEEKIEEACRLAGDVLEGCLPRQRVKLTRVVDLLDEVRTNLEVERTAGKPDKEAIADTCGRIAEALGKITAKKPPQGVR